MIRIWRDISSDEKPKEEIPFDKAEISMPERTRLDWVEDVWGIYRRMCRR